ncbi:MAG: PH domain-containing protein [Propionibacteriaceae bacterium]
MGYPRRLLGADEYVVVHTRTHAKVLVGRAVLLIVFGALTGAGVAAMPTSTRPWGPGLVLALGLLLVVTGVLRPFLRWWTSTYTLTNRRLITRTGILARNGRDLPLDRVNDVSFERSLADRMLGCGTLHVQTAADLGGLVLPDVPGVHDVHRSMSELMYEPQPVSS